MPVTIPALGASSSYKPLAARALSSRNAEPGSRRWSMRSRTGSFPRSRCLAIERSSPPAPRSLTDAVRARSSSTRAVIRSALARASSLAGSSRLRRTVTAPSIASRSMAADRRGAAEPLARPRRLAAMQSVSRSRKTVRVGTSWLVVALLALAGCTSAANVALPGTGPLVTVSMRGGMCPAGACDNAVILERDGRVHAAAKPPNDLGHVSAEAYAALETAIRVADFTALRSKPFTGECPVNFDGQELIFEFAVAGGTQRIASCEVDVDWGSPLFVALGVALGEWVPFPLT